MKKIAKVFGFLILTVLVLSGALVGAGYYMLNGSLPKTSGEHNLSGLKELVIVERDFQGIPTIRGANRLDVARATGFIHAQERLFQMDLLRRNASGELSEFLGAATIEVDKKNRFHGFKDLSGKIFSQMDMEAQALLRAYSDGVNAGINSLSILPFEYLLTGTTPRSWTPEDSILVGLGLYFELQDGTGNIKMSQLCMQKNLPQVVYEFLLKNGSIWEAALDGSRIPMKDIPNSEHFVYLSGQTGSIAEIERKPQRRLGGSNNWVVDGRFTEDGKPLLACDMHLGLLVPNIWYRAAFLYKDSGGKEVRVDGVSLPGTPMMSVASNHNVAWGFTNAYLDTADVIPLEIDHNDNSLYVSENGLKKFGERIETIHVKGQQPLEYTISTTDWGPVFPENIMNKKWAFKWVAHQTDGFNIKLMDLETTNDVESALAALSKTKMPVLNCVLADTKGQIAWSFVGFIPNQKNDRGYWEKELSSEKYPIIKNPKNGMLWTANNRCLGSDWEESFCGDLNGIRAYQIQSNLKGLKKATSDDMLAIQLNDDAAFLVRWQQLLLKVLNSDIALKDSRKKELRYIVENWGKRSSTDSAGYYFVRTFRLNAMDAILGRILSPCIQSWQGFDSTPFNLEEPVWLIVSQQPAYLADPNYASWENELLAYVDWMLDDPLVKGKSLKTMTWGKVNTLNIQHPLSLALPFMSFWLDMPREPVCGDYYMPRLTGPNVGASQRMVVTPGEERKGIMHMPCGQSGHPLSKHYRDGQAAWVNGEATPFLPGEVKERLFLVP